jgi:hypothetical protein
MKFWVLIMTLFFNQNAFARPQPEICFPQMKDLIIDLKTFNSDSYFFQANFPVKSIFSNPLKRKYQIEINPKLLNCPPSIEGLKAIMTHELKHIDDYLKLNRKDMTKFAIKFGLNKNYRAHYERETDIFALETNQKKGLKEFRQWVYQWLTPRELKIKKRFYLTPEEIDAWE